MRDAIYESYLDFLKTLGQVSPCQWDQGDDCTFGYLSSETLHMSYLNILMLMNTSMARDDWIKRKFLVRQAYPKYIDVYSPGGYIENDNLPCIKGYEFQLSYVIYYCSLSSYKLSNINRISHQVSRVGCDRSLEDWVTVQSSFHPSMVLSSKSYINYFKSLLESTSSIELLLIYDEGVAVNASLMFMSGHACYSGWNVTLPNYQCHGYGLASLAGRIQRARSSGMKDYVGLASPASLSLFEKLNLDAVGSFISYKKVLG